MPAARLYGILHSGGSISKDCPPELTDSGQSVVAARLVYGYLFWLHDDRRYKSLKIIRMFPGIDQDITLHDLLMLLRHDGTAPVEIEVNGLNESLLHMVKLVCWPENRSRQVEIRVSERENASGPLPGFFLYVTVLGRT